MALQFSMNPSENITAVVLAGGFGTRIKHLLGNLPKPMLPVCGHPFLEWVVRYLAAQKIRRAILSTGYRAETVEKHFASQPVADVRVNCVPETQPLGTAGGFLNAIRRENSPQNPRIESPNAEFARSFSQNSLRPPAVPSPLPSDGRGEGQGLSGRSFRAQADEARVHGEEQTPDAWLVLNGDSLALASLDGMFRQLEDAKVEGAILGLRVADASRYGTIAKNSAGELVGFKEKKPGAGIINAGVYLIRDAVLKKFPARTPLSFETDVFPALIAGQARLKVCEVAAPFLDIGTPESLARAEKFINENKKQFG
jgi:NDP-sugar pyrophosphorylase family protein